jgi:hypothetical protein
MALATTITGDGILVSVDVPVQVWRVYGGTKIIKYAESIRTEVREWVALTKSCAQTAAEAASQTGLPAGAVASYSAQEDTRVVNSYKLVKTITYAATLTRTLEDYPA